MELVTAISMLDALHVCLCYDELVFVLSCSPSSSHQSALGSFLSFSALTVMYVASHGVLVSLVTVYTH